MSNNQFRTRDLYLAAFLKVADVPMLPNVIDDGITLFVFEDDGTLRELKDQYFSDYAKVQALSYAKAIKWLKSTIIHKEGKNHA